MSNIVRIDNLWGQLHNDIGNHELHDRDIVPLPGAYVHWSDNKLLRRFFCLDGTCIRSSEYQTVRCMMLYTFNYSVTLGIVQLNNNHQIGLVKDITVYGWSVGGVPVSNCWCIRSREDRIMFP